MDLEFLEVHIPGDTIEMFLKAAEQNTLSDTETCGFLAGTIVGGVKVITSLYLPP